jgi:Pyruvate/2-oxoacid:ferredoxin oxidoreductase delta subunit
MKKRSRLLNWPRTAIQWGVILAIVILAMIPLVNKSFKADFEAYCPFGGVQALGSYILNQALACTMTSAQIVMGVLMMVGVFLFSKLFCGYICPIGTFSEWLGKLGDRLKIRITFSGIVDKLLRSLKYILLFITFYFTFDSNELFCKQFDPYYAVMSGYDMDVNAIYATIAIALVILGSVFIRLFFCKYICPFGALANILKFTFFFVGVLVIYILLVSFGLEISYVWPLAIACIGGYIIEVTGIGSKVFPVAKITRNEDSCINCNLCTKKCPQAIDVASVKVVRNVDCNLCGECIDVCPEQDTVQINKRRSLRWLPVVAVIFLAGLGISLGEVVEIPTIDQTWVGQDEIENAAVFTQEGLRSIKCYGSCMAFAGKLKRVEGVYGLAAYVGSKKIKVTYDSTRVTPEKIQEAFFTPLKTPLKPLKKGAVQVQKVSVMLENFFDPFDFNYMSILLRQKTDAVGLQIEFGCPVNVYVYYPGDSEVDIKELTEIMESKVLSYESQGKPVEVKLKYEVVKKPDLEIITKEDYLTVMFEPYVTSFNGYSKYSDDVIDTYRLTLGKNATLKQRFPHMVSHLSHNNGIIQFKTTLDEEFKQVLDILFVDSMTNASEVYSMLVADTLHFTYKDGRKGSIENMFSFEEEGVLLEEVNK